MTSNHAQAPLKINNLEQVAKVSNLYSLPR